MKRIEELLSNFDTVREAKTIDNIICICLEKAGEYNATFIDEDELIAGLSDEDDIDNVICHLIEMNA